MKWLTYSKQMTLGIVCVVLGHVLSWVSGYGIFLNLGWIAYGMLFLLHPVWLESASQNPHIKNYVRIAGAVVILIGCTIRFGTGDDFWQRRVSESLGIDVSRGTVDFSYDDHSGFHGDGTMYAVLSFPDDTLEDMISAPGGWYALPLTENLQTLIYGNWTETKVIGPFVGVAVPAVEQGWWYFYDRQGETHDDSEVLNRGSFNYTVAIYDADQNQLIYIEYDT